MDIVIGCDNAAVSLKNTLIEFLRSKGVTVENMGCDSSDDPTYYPTVAKRVCVRQLWQAAMRSGAFWCAAPASACA